MGRAPCCDKANVKKGPWSPEEDAKLKSYIEQHGTGGNWIVLPQKIGLKRCGKSCRLRWLNYLRPNIKHGGFSEEEDNIICGLYISIGSRWSIIAAQLPGRTDNDIKNYWNTRLRKKHLGSKPRKDQNQLGRRGGGSKQQAKEKREENYRNLSIGDGAGVSSCHPSTYWPEKTASVLPTYPINQAKHRVNGWRFSSHNPLGVPQTTGLPLQQVYDASTSGNFIATSVETGPLMTDYNLAELDDMFVCSSTKLEGLDSFYGLKNMVDDKDGSCTTDGMNWSDVSALIYQPTALSYQGTMQPCLFEEPVHLGLQ